MRPFTILAVIAMLLLLGGSACVNVGAGHSPKTRFFLLEAKSEHCPKPDWARQKMLAGNAIGIGPVALPHYLDRPQILTRINHQELLADEFSQWAEPLKDSIPRIMGENLASLGGGGRIRVFPWGQSTQINIQVSMNIHRFESDDSGRIALKATWQIVNIKDRQPLRERLAIIEKASTGADIGGRVKAMSLALADLSLEIGENLAQLIQAQKKSTPPQN